MGYVSGILHIHYYSKAQLISTCADPDGEEPEGEDPEGEEPEQPLHPGTGSLLPALHTFVPTDYSQRVYITERVCNSHMVSVPAIWIT